MSRKLEQFINDHRAQFDSDEPDEKVWQNIKKNLAQPSKTAMVKPLRRWKWMAAAGIIAILSTCIFLFTQNSARTDITTETPEDLLHEINPAYAKEVYHFTQLIELKQNELKQIGEDQPELYKQFMHDITMLDSSYTRLQTELPANPNREQLLEAMIQNLQLQTELLNQQLRVIKQIKQSKTSDNENNSTI